MRRITTLCLGLLLTLALATPHGPARAAPKRCAPGKTCSCSGSSGCSYTCAGKGCTFNVIGSGGAALFCDAGGCTVNKSGSGPAKTACKRGGCTVWASGSGTTLLDCPGKGCSMSCSGSGSCKLLGCPDCPLNCTGASCSRS